MTLVSQAHIAKLNESELFRDSAGLQSMIAQNILDYHFLGVMADKLFDQAKALGYGNPEAMKKMALVDLIGKLESEA